MSIPTLLNVSIGDYRLVSFLGAGGMGEVFRAVHAQSGRVVAVKVLTQAGQNSGLIERFRNEARIQAGLRHPNIAAFYHFLYFDNRPCIIMEYIDGQTLAERIRLSGPLPRAQAIRIFQAVVEAMAYIHSRGVVHRDLKPHNIKIGSNGAVKLLDFGIAKAAAQPDLTQPGDVVGTLQYLSPEQLKGGLADARSDVWMLGILLYEMVTGTVPFEAKTFGELYEKITKAAYKPAALSNASLPREMETLIARCLRKRPAQRYASAQELLAAVQRLTAPAPPPRPKPTPRPSTAVKAHTMIAATKRRWPILLAALVLLCLIAGRFFVPAETGPGGDTEPKPSELRRVHIGVISGRAEVYRDGQWLASTPYEFKAPLGKRFAFILKREGSYDKSIDFQVNEVRNQYDYTMEKIKKD